MMRVVIAGSARNDLQDITIYIAEDNPARARSYVRKLREACISLSDSPLRFSLLPDHEGFRFRPYGRYVIIYSVLEDHVVIHRVVNAALDRSNMVFSSGGEEN